MSFQSHGISIRFYFRFHFSFFYFFIFTQIIAINMPSKSRELYPGLFDPPKIRDVALGMWINLCAVIPYHNKK
jgi:hypothetical protein